MDQIKNRRSIRKYTSQPVEKELIDEVLSAAILAPSAKNRQPWKFIVYSENSKKELLSAMEKGLIKTKAEFANMPNSEYMLSDAFNTLKIMQEAPVIIMVLNTNGSSPFSEIDTFARITEICDSLSIGAAIENMLLKATELGLGTLWIANTCYAYNELAEFIGTKSQLIGAVALGYAAEVPFPRPRKSLDEVAEYR
ncbi:nitroreductase family protein [Ruminococcus flavefaciens]|uniref:F420 biosynthesis protein FbiB, C-terminal domain-containing protein n=1 Tax=Ruminococcus flavefaciens TaxID=1265 RepID=A0A1M7K1Y2_RUMFL|nr:nitroreductase family protein [Ruminococcus flavefaciens]SHM59214.1 F420 biosynthesis protein FbiB, C-terminal domain-containing protein [Ruminococcus flavefaciens]